MERAAQADEPGSGGQAQLRQQSNNNVRVLQHAVPSGAQCAAHQYRGRLPQTQAAKSRAAKMGAKSKGALQATPKAMCEPHLQLNTSRT